MCIFTGEQNVITETKNLKGIPSSSKYDNIIYICLFWQVRNLGTNQCLDTLAKNDPGGEPGMYMCHGMGNNQVLKSAQGA